MTKRLRVGFAALGFQGYSKKHADMMIETCLSQDTPILAYLWGSFGRGKANLKRWYSRCGDNAITQVYLSNEVDRRKNRIDKFSLLHKVEPKKLNKRLENGHTRTINAIKKRALKVVEFHNQYGKGELRIAVGLEHNMTKDALNAYIDAVREVAPGIKIISNPVIRAPFEGKGKADFLEIHEVTHKTAPNVPYIAGTDGYDICENVCGRFINQGLGDSALIKAMYDFDGADYFLMWHSSFNSLKADSQNAPRPSDRKSFLSQKCLDHIEKIIRNYYSTVGGSVKPKKEASEVKGCKKLNDPFKTSGFVWKESDHGGLVVVFPPRLRKMFSKVEVIEPNGKKHRLYQTGWANPFFWQGQDRERQHWRHKKSSHQFPKNSILRATAKKGVFDWLKRKKKRVLCWLIENPAIRNGK